MKPASIKGIRYSDTITERRRRRKNTLRVFLAVLAGGAVGIAGYWAFWSGTFAIGGVEVTGLERVSYEQIMSRVNEALSASALNALHIERNILLVRPHAIQAELLDAFPEIKSVGVSRDFPDKVELAVTERDVAGTWCFQGQCRNFDVDGHAWGEVSRSSGSLLLIVDDQKHTAADFIGPSLLAPVLAVADGLARQGVGFQYLTIPDDQFNDLWAMTNRGYPIYFNISEPISDQLNVLRVFLEEKTEDPNSQPQYLDLRIAGRVYFK